MSNYVRARSVAFFDASDDKPKLSLMIETDGPLEKEKEKNLTHLYIELTPNQIALMLREYADYLTRSMNHADATPK